MWYSSGLPHDGSLRETTNLQASSVHDRAVRATMLHQASADSLLHLGQAMCAEADSLHDLPLRERVPHQDGSGSLLHDGQGNSYEESSLHRLPQSGVLLLQNPDTLRASHSHLQRDSSDSSHRLPTSARRHLLYSRAGLLRTHQGLLPVRHV